VNEFIDVKNSILLNLPFEIKTKKTSMEELEIVIDFSKVMYYTQQLFWI